MSSSTFAAILIVSRNLSTQRLNTTNQPARPLLPNQDGARSMPSSASRWAWAYLDPPSPMFPNQRPIAPLEDWAQWAAQRDEETAELLRCGQPRKLSREEQCERKRQERDVREWVIEEEDDDETWRVEEEERTHEQRQRVDNKRWGMQQERNQGEEGPRREVEKDQAAVVKVLRESHGERRQSYTERWVDEQEPHRDERLEQMCRDQEKVSKLDRPQLAPLRHVEFAKPPDKKEWDGVRDRWAHHREFAEQMGWLARRQERTKENGGPKC
ncbi:hypothetical protein GTA08_BOTSDO11871 [Botryosphaeria dothidea]|uniref:Uncharacterized protein n=1 Tax=Botryosphaeria dothidea TaxID=55169 RepID=A0A8H4J460_9PEZI|nr:hypothetical protein GTA08_BOTSDO11871 [Botryosphaeria dothidea]